MAIAKRYKKDSYAWNRLKLGKKNKIMKCMGLRDLSRNLKYSEIYPSLTTKRFHSYRKGAYKCRV